MSVQFGRWHFEGKPIASDYLDKVREILEVYAPDGGRSYCQDGISIVYSALHTTKESRNEIQPHDSASGVVITWDGRLDNRDEIIRQLSGESLRQPTDVAIVAAAYERWGTACFSRLVGDWALSIWNPIERSLILAKDFLGTRHLYYFLERRQLTWCTVLDPLLLLSEQSLALDEEYIAGWLGSFPATHLTPYMSISAVPPSSFVLIRPGTRSVTRYRSFDPHRRIRYRTDSEYEEHFRIVFAEAVRRRLRSDTPILAELSGGMDSSSIVCMADYLLAKGAAETPQLDTLSYYNDSEPNWDERPFFSRVEEKRGQTGCHIDVSSEPVLLIDLTGNGFGATPASTTRPNEGVRRFIDCMASNGNRVVLSGIGGDEVLGGVPTPIPELGDLIARGRWGRLTHELKVWALLERKPWPNLLAETATNFLPLDLPGRPNHLQPPSWVRSEFARRNRAALLGYRARWRLLGPLPSFQSNLNTLDALRRQLACSALSTSPPYEKRYPYLDRDLLAYLFAIPREQIIRPGRRRSLMRRALREIVPDEILDRKRKAFVARAPLLAIAKQWTRVLEITREMASDSLGIIDAPILRETLQKARDSREVHLVPLARTLLLESWLRSLPHGKVFHEAPGASSRLRPPIANPLSAGVRWERDSIQSD